MPDRDEQKILITQAAAGMQLSRPVVTLGKVVLCGAGTKLSEHLIQRLTLRGIKRIFVQGHPVPARSQEPLDARIRALRQRFSRVGHIPLMGRIERAIEERMVHRS
ncbi:MAG: hypothetical protein PF961_01490 [Planctomycetota bacterium]|jgi:hypothetical protein|nr:hypothetical protein [Planctomycetota bacterium]